MSHHWSGWPGAWCFDCGDNDPLEAALACRVCRIKASEDDPADDYICPEHQAMIRECPEPGSNRHNPYVKRLAEQ